MPMKYELNKALRSNEGFCFSILINNIAFFLHQAVPKKIVTEML
jgi:hypothetical protein